MKWKGNNAALTLEPRDFKIMAQCRMPMGEILRREHPNRNIPPLWSVLSYVMFSCRSNYANMWYRYRSLLEMAENTDRWYDTRYIPKANGGARRISVPCHGIRKQQKFILDNILKGLPVSDYAYAYCEGRSIGDCAAPHVGQDVLIHLDIRNFFGSVTEDKVFKALYRETGYSKSLCRFLARMCCFRGCLPQGTVTSPKLSNIVFRLCDEALADLAKWNGLQYTRYSDDMFFSGKGEIPVGEVLRKISETLIYFGYRINEDKTKVLRRQHRQAVLGLTVNERIQVSREYRRKLSQELYYLEKFGKDCKGAVEAGDYLKYMQRLQGRLAYVLQVDPNNAKLWKAHMALSMRIKRYCYLQERGFV